MTINPTSNVLINHTRDINLVISESLYDISLKEKRIPKLSLITVQKYGQKFKVQPKCKIDPSTNSFFFQPHSKSFRTVKQTYYSIKSE